MNKANEKEIRKSQISFSKYIIKTLQENNYSEGSIPSIQNKLDVEYEKYKLCHYKLRLEIIEAKEKIDLLSEMITKYSGLPDDVNEIKKYLVDEIKEEAELLNTLLADDLKTLSKIKLSFD